MLPAQFQRLMINGIYATISSVIAVMLPPVLIFFPLFTVLEDLGYLPRAAFLMDHTFQKCGGCGKQALTMAMGFGCNAVGVTGCRIIASPKERIMAILTNAFVPCNGRLPTMIVLISACFTENRFLAAAILTGWILLGVFITLLVSSLLNKTLFKNEVSMFFLELPPYRKPKLTGILLRTFLDRTVFVLGRALLVSVPAGIALWLLQEIYIGDVDLLHRLCEWMDPLGLFMGMNGVILVSFILSFPANELLLPLIGLIMNFNSSATLLSGGQSFLYTVEIHFPMALSIMIFTMFHWPCGTTCLTIHKETGSWKWTAIATALPTLIGFLLCTLISFIL